jgi:hypothetical protein
MERLEGSVPCLAFPGMMAKNATDNLGDEDPACPMSKSGGFSIPSGESLGAESGKMARPSVELDAIR